MASTSFTWNAYESKIVGTLPVAGTSIALESAAGLVVPVYLCLEPDVPERREWIKVTALTGDTIDNMDRGLEGSAGAGVGGVEHPSGSVIRAVFTKQLQDDLFFDITALEALINDHVVDPGDPHAPADYLTETEADARYLKLLADNDPMQGSVNFAQFEMAGVQNISNDGSVRIVVGSGGAAVEVRANDGTAHLLVDNAGPSLGTLPLLANAQKIVNLADGTDPTDAVTLQQLDANDPSGVYLPLAGGVMTGAIEFDTGARIDNDGDTFLIEATNGGNFRDVASFGIGSSTQPLVEFATAWNNANQGAILRWPATTAATTGEFDLARTNDELRYKVGGTDIFALLDIGIQQRAAQDSAPGLLRNISVDDLGGGTPPAGGRFKGEFFFEVDTVDEITSVWYFGDSGWGKLGTLTPDVPGTEAGTGQGTPSALTGSLVTKGGINVAMPSGWNSAKVVARAAIFYAGVVTGDMQIVGRIQIDGNNGPSFTGNFATADNGEDLITHMVHTHTTSEATIDIDIQASDGQDVGGSATPRWWNVDYTLIRVS